MIDLDNKEEIIKLQKTDKVIISIDSISKQLDQSFRESCSVSFPEKYSQAKNVVVCGMGGSRFPAYIIKELFKEKLKVPYVYNDDYSLPGFVNAKTLVILSSYSGTTEEVLSCFEKAKAKNALLAGITEGGPLEKLLIENTAPYFKVDPIHNPSGQPKIGFGYFVGEHIGIMVELKLMDENKETIQKSIDVLDGLIKDFKIDVKTEINPVKKLAKDLYQKYPYFIVSEFLTGVGNAMANQLNETAKSISGFRVIPELNHHLMEGLKFPDKLKEILTFVFFDSNLYSSKIQKRFKITKEVVDQNKIQAIWYELKGSNKIEQAFVLMALGSYLSMYMSVLYQQDPTIIPYVDYFKKKIKE